MLTACRFIPRLALTLDGEVRCMQPHTAIQRLSHMSSQNDHLIHSELISDPKLNLVKSVHKRVLLKLLFANLPLNP